MDEKKKYVVSKVKTVGAAISGLCASSVATAAIKTIVSPKASLLGKISFFVGTTMIAAVVADRCQKHLESLVDDCVSLAEELDPKKNQELFSCGDVNQD